MSKAFFDCWRMASIGCLRAVEAGQIPVSIAVDIAAATDAETQTVLQQAYEKKLLRGHKLIAAKRLIEQTATPRKGPAS